MAQIALMGHNHVCPLHVGGPIISGNTTCTVNGIPMALVGDRCSCAYGEPDVITAGSSSMTINGIQVATTNSATVHGGIIVQGNPALTLF